MYFQIYTSFMVVTIIFLNRKTMRSVLRLRGEQHDFYGNAQQKQECFLPYFLPNKLSALCLALNLFWLVL